jgi:hypothetical protein
VIETLAFQEEAVDMFSQGDLFEQETSRALLDQLLTDSRLYRTGADYQVLLEFVVKLRNVAPFNAMLLQLQKPGLRFAASALDWRARFGRTINEGARPLLILWPFGPVATVYDVQVIWICTRSCARLASRDAAWADLRTQLSGGRGYPKLPEQAERTATRNRGQEGHERVVENRPGAPRERQRR